MSINIITCGDDGYAATIEVLIKNAAALYDNSRIWIYDWGISDPALARLGSYPGVTIIDWKKIAGWKLAFHRKLFRLRNRGIVPYSVAHILGVEQVLIEKIRCFAHLSRELHSEPFVFFDGDAFPIRNVVALTDENVDLALTIRRPHEFNWAGNNCAILNTGVIGFGRNSSRRDEFLSYWLAKAERSRELLAEQTALTRIIEKQDRDLLYPGRTGTLRLPNSSLTVRVLAGDEYNFNHIEELIPLGGQIPETIRVLHFKSGRFRDPDLQPIIAQADLNRRASA